MPITQFLKDQGAFGPDDIRAMSRALEEACNALNLNGDARAREAVAIRIIELVRRGERDPIHLRDRVILDANGGTRL